MPELTSKVREIARNLLEEGRVKVVIGFERGTMPLRRTPCFVRQKGEVSRLIWDSFCENNLAKYLVGRAEPLAIVAKGCDVRSIVELIKENQLRREQVIIIGVPCQGMVDWRGVEAGIEGGEVREAEEKDGKLTLRGADFEKTLKRDDFLYPSCQTCTHRNPVIYDLLAGELVTEREADPYQDVAEFETWSGEERWGYFTLEFSECIRCYACRNACPLCYCQECFVDSTHPQWVGKTTNDSDTMAFHLTRAFHLAGRCVDCGACERACPVGVDIRKLNRKLVKDVKERFGYEAGLSLEQVAPLATFKPDDPEEFMVNP